MQPHLLSLLVAAVCASALLGGAAVSCPAGARFKNATLGGKFISQKLFQLTVATGECLWVAEGSVASAFRTEDCIFCRVDQYGKSCLTTPEEFVEPPCVKHLGPDCRWHVTDPRNQTIACDIMAILMSGLPPPNGK